MKAISLAAAGIAVALIALTLVPSAGDYRAGSAIGALLFSVVALVTIVVGWKERPSRLPAVTNADTHSEPQAASDGREKSSLAPLTRAAVSQAGEAEVVGFLATLQEEGRFVDFLQDTITGYSDAQVGAAARVVHQGCKAVLDDYLRIVPIREESEGARVTLPADYVADEYRLVGTIGEPPFSGTLVHRGWKTESVRLPRMVRESDQRLPTIAPAEVELR